jgi:hypothetical protein
VYLWKVQGKVKFMLSVGFPGTWVSIAERKSREEGYRNSQRLSKPQRRVSSNTERT